MTLERDRVICVSLTESEWKAFVERHPQPVDWLRQQILSQLDAGAPVTPRPEPTASPAAGTTPVR
jgi:hypothetical protein